jgi:two-component system chemotaxis response regulator CheB
MQGIRQKVRALIADDSVIYRSQIKKALEGLPGVEVVGVAANGKITLERLNQSSVDLLILDLEMPEMDGLQTLKEMSRRGGQTKTLVFSALSKQGAEITLDALRHGACDFITKPDGSSIQAEGGLLIEPSQRIKGLLEPRISALFPDLLMNLGSDLESESRGPLHAQSSGSWDQFQPEVIVIGSSTGGPTVLEGIFAELPKPLRCPVLVAQHMPPFFTATLAERIQKISGIPTSEARDGMPLLPNSIIIAPGDYHMRIRVDGGVPRVVLDQGPQINSVRPAVDPLFASAASVFGEKCLGVVLTGMGADGAEGSKKIKESGGWVIIQSQETCVVFGMPGAVKAAGAFDYVMSPSDLVTLFKEKLRCSTF